MKHFTWPSLQLAFNSPQILTSASTAGSLSHDFADMHLVMSLIVDLAGRLETAKITSGMSIEVRSRDGPQSLPLPRL